MLSNKCSKCHVLYAESKISTEVTGKLEDDITAAEVQSHISAGEEEDTEAGLQQNENVSISSGPIDVSENGTTTKGLYFLFNSFSDFFLFFLGWGYVI